MSRNPTAVTVLKGRFNTELDLRYLDGREWSVLRAFVYESDTAGLILVPAGFVTDFASIPRFFWRLLPPTGQYGKAAVIHDYLYVTATMPVTRAEADAVFLEAMTDLGVPVVTRRLMWAAVRAFGADHFQAR